MTVQRPTMAAELSPMNGPAGDDKVTSRVWAFPNMSWARDGSLVGYEVWATDRLLGVVDVVVTESGRARLEVVVGRWATRRRRVIPAGAVAAIDRRAGMVMLNLTSGDVDAAPDPQPNRPAPATWYRRLENHYRRWVRTDVVAAEAAADGDQAHEVAS